MLAPAAFATSVPWRFQTRRWTCLSSQASREGGPSARSCHKVCLDADRGLLYTLGGYIDPVMRGDVPTMCDFYVYDVERRVWTCLSQDVAGDGGPGLIYDHQMCFHAERRTIYVFGGRCVPMCAHLYRTGHLPARQSLVGSRSRRGRGKRLPQRRRRAGQSTRGPVMGPRTTTVGSTATTFQRVNGASSVQTKGKRLSRPRFDHGREEKRAGVGGFAPDLVRLG